MIIEPSSIVGENWMEKTMVVNWFVGRKSRLIFSLPPKHTDLLIVTKIEGKKPPPMQPFIEEKIS